MAEEEKEVFRTRAKGTLMLSPIPRSLSLVAESALTLIAVKVLNASTSASGLGASSSSSSGRSSRRGFRDGVADGAGTLTKRKLYGPQHNVDL